MKRSEASDWHKLERFTFGDSPAMADELGALVLSGLKTATCWAHVHGPLTEVGGRTVMEDGAGRPRAVLETVELTVRRFDEVDEAFARDEGEGDRSLAYWQRAHEDFFTREGTFAPDMRVYCERFRIVEIISDES
jgi:uncharacterized protein YhfF